MLNICMLKKCGTKISKAILNDKAIFILNIETIGIAIAMIVIICNKFILFNFF